MASKPDYAKNMFENIAILIENEGKDDEAYASKQKLIDIFDVLESLLAYTVFTVCTTEDDVKACAEESFENVKHKALKMLADHPQK